MSATGETRQELDLAMPMYEYRCHGCGHEFEFLVRTQDIPACPACAGHDLERMLSLFAVSTADRSSAAITRARHTYQRSTNRQEQLRHERDDIREHMREDYGVDLPKNTPTKPSA